MIVHSIRTIIKLSDKKRDFFHFTLFLQGYKEYAKHELDNLYFIIECVAQIEYGMEKKMYSIRWNVRARSITRLQLPLNLSSIAIILIEFMSISTGKPKKRKIT